MKLKTLKKQNMISVVNRQTSSVRDIFAYALKIRWANALNSLLLNINNSYPFWRSMVTLKLKKQIK